MMYLVSLLKYLVFEPYDLVTYFVFCSIPLFYGLIVYLKLKFYVPQLLLTTKKELRYNQFMFLLFLLIIIGIFFLRLARIDHYINLSQLVLPILVIKYFIPLEFLICLGLSIFLFLMIVYAYVYAKVKKILLTLYLYYYQYKLVEESVSLLHEKIGVCIYFLTDNVHYCCEKLSFSKKNCEYISQLAFCIWPMSFRILKKYLYIGIIPYSIWFDIETQNYCLSHVFQVLPWYFLYSLVRGAYKFIKENTTMEGMCFTSFNYDVKGWKLQDD